MSNKQVPLRTNSGERFLFVLQHIQSRTLTLSPPALSNRCLLNAHSLHKRAGLYQTKELYVNNGQDKWSVSGNLPPFRLRTIPTG